MAVALSGCATSYDTGIWPHMVVAPERSTDNIVVVDNGRSDTYLAVDINGRTVEDSLFYGREAEKILLPVRTRRTNYGSYPVATTYTIGVKVFDSNGEMSDFQCRSVTIQGYRSRAWRWVVSGPQQRSSSGTGWYGRWQSGSSVGSTSCPSLR